MEETAQPLQIGRYVLHDELASGGMAKVHLGRAGGALGFSKIVAIKRILPHLLSEQDFVDMFVDETRLAARIQHPNVVSTLDAVVTDREVFLVMEFVLGESFARLLRAARKRQEPVPPAIAVAIIVGALRGLHAAHEAKNDFGELLGVVHRDVSPQNVLVGVDGVARVIDFGVAKARGRLMTTRDGRIKGKMAYMAPEQLSGMEPDRRTDVYAAAVILWEALTGRRLHSGDNDAIVYSNVLHAKVDPPSRYAQYIPPELDVIVMRALERDARLRFATAEQMVLALEGAVTPASPTAVGEWVKHLATEAINARAARIAEIERGVFTPSSQRVLNAQESGSLPQMPSTGSHSRERSAPQSLPTGADVSGGFGRSMPHEVPPRRSSRITTAIVVLTVLSSLMASAIVVIYLKRPGLLRPASRVAQTPTTNESASPPPTPTPSATVPSAEPVASTTPSASASASSTTTPSATSKPTATAVAAQKPKPKSKCDPPWYLDEKGIKRFKPECM